MTMTGNYRPLRWAGLIRSPHVALVAAVTFGIMLLFGIGPNFYLCLLACMVLFVSTLLLWRDGDVPILLYLFWYQWLQSSIAAFYANTRGINVNSLSLFQTNAEGAAAYCLIGCFIFAVACRLAAGRWSRQDEYILKFELQNIRPRQIMTAYIFINFVSIIAILLAREVRPLSQPLLAVAFLKWGAFFALTYFTFATRKIDRRLWLAAFAFEFLAGIGGYFSGFKFVFLVSLLAMATAGLRLSAARALGAAALGAVMLLVGVYWQSVKTDYRMFVAQGDNNQTVNVNYIAATSKLLDLVMDVKGDDLKLGAEEMLLRISYTEYFGAALDHVPQQTPFQNGALWGDAISRVFMPRVLFPNKSSLDDSVVTNEFTGLGVSGADEGTSISLGYMAESYLDFGPFGQFIPVFAFGLVCGGIHRMFMKSRHTGPVIGAALSVTALLTVGAIEVSAAKLVGWLALTFVINWSLQRMLGRRARWFLSGGRSLRPFQRPVMTPVDGRALYAAGRAELPIARRG